MPDAAELGAILRQCREAKGLSLDDLSHATRIVPRLLLALEENRLADLPAPIFVRGFIRAYCAAVGEPPERALALYDATTGAARGPSAVPRTTALVQRPGRRPRRRWGRLAPRLATAGALVVVGGVAYHLVSSAAGRPAEPPAAPAAKPAAAPVRVARETPTPAAHPEPAPVAALDAGVAPAAVAPPAAPADARGHVLVARVREPTWVSVRRDGGTASQELLDAGSVREWQSAQRFTVTVGNAGGLTLELDGVALPPLGGRGQVVRDVMLPREPTP